MAFLLNDSGKVSTLNSSSTPLAGGATFTGTSEDVSTYASVVLAVKTDVSGTLYCDFSTDGINWDSTLTFDVAANVNDVHRITVTRQYFRARYVNDASAQSFFRLQCLFGKQQTLTSSLNSTIQDDADTIVIRPLDFNLMVAEGLYQLRNNFIKDGLNLDIDTGSVPQDLWDNGGTYTGFVSAPAAAECNVLGADTGTVYYAYLASASDTNYTFGSVAISGIGTYSLGHDIYRCNFAYFVSSDGVSFNTAQIAIRHTATPANVFVTIPTGYSQSFCAAYTTPAGASAYIDRITTNFRGNATGVCDGVFYYKPLGESPRYRFPHEYSSNLYFDDIDYLIRIPPQTDIIPRVIFASNNNIVAKISYRLILKIQS